MDLTAPAGREPAVWVIELRRPDGADSLPFRDAVPGEELVLPEASAHVLEPYPPDCGHRTCTPRWALLLLRQRHRWTFS